MLLLKVSVACLTAAIFAAVLFPAAVADVTQRTNTVQAAPNTDTLAQTKDSGSDEAEGTGDYVVKPWRSLRTHLHNKIIHVPIGFALSAFLVSILSRFRPEVLVAVRWLVLIAALGAVAAYLTGTNQAEAFEGSSKEWVVETHQRLGIATACSLWIWAGLSWIPRFRSLAFVAGILVLALIGMTGFFGGIIAHG